MGKIEEYIDDRLSSEREKYNTVVEEIHRLGLEIESSKAVVDKIMDKNDDTSLTFLTTGNIQGFDGVEIKKLRDLIVDMNHRKECLETERDELSESIDMLLLLQEEQIHDKNVALNNKYSNVDVIEFIESDRQRIARDIHDSVVQTLSALMYKMEFIKKVSESDIQRAKLELETGSSLVKECIEELRNVIYDLRPMSLDDLGFENAFYNLMSKIKDSTDMIVEYQYDGNIDNIKNIISITMIRIIQELCSNSIKYSNGKKIKVRVVMKDDYIELYQSDDGEGYDITIDKSPKSNNTGYGLPILMERIKLLNGTINIQHGENNRGMEYQIIIPCNHVIDEEK